MAREVVGPGQAEPQQPCYGLYSKSDRMPSKGFKLGVISDCRVN